ncbi:MAG: hypothetical protein E7354_05390 [Clostridiales bacterium]|nr:hypothetical protein [Clostridiales bacterium]
MVRMFVKTMKSNRVTGTYKYEIDEDFEIDHFYEYVKDICEHFDSPTPVILAKHIRDYIVFSTTTFTKSDFVEKVFFDKLILEQYKA